MTEKSMFSNQKSKIFLYAKQKFGIKFFLSNRIKPVLQTFYSSAINCPKGMQEYLPLTFAHIPDFIKSFFNILIYLSILSLLIMKFRAFYKRFETIYLKYLTFRAPFYLIWDKNKFFHKIIKVLRKRGNVWLSQ